jgi:alpha-methylacyl-CoA racemase
MAVGAIEPQFYAALVDGLGLGAADMPHQMDRSAWEATRARFAGVFKSKTRDQWCQIFDGTDSCVAPVLSMTEAPSHPHNRHRRTFADGVRGAPAPQAAPRLSRTPGHASTDAPVPGASSRAVFAELGMSEDEIDRLTAEGAIG